MCNIQPPKTQCNANIKQCKTSPNLSLSKTPGIKFKIVRAMAHRQ